MMKRATTVAAAVVLAFGATTVPAWADSSLGTSYAAATTVSPGAGLTPSVVTSGELAGLLDFLTPVFDQFVTPLTSALTALPDTAVESVAGVVRDQDATAATTATPAVAAGGFPDCSADAWTAGNCFSTQVSTPDSPVTLSVDDATGFAGANDSDSTAGAKTSGITLSALGIQVATVGSAESRMTCAGYSECTGTSSFDDVGLLGGAVKLKSGAGGALLVAIGDGDYQPVDQVDTSATVGDRGASLTAANGGLEVSIPISLSELLDAIGAPDTLDSLDAAGDGSTITLDVTVSPGETGAQYGGLQIGVGIAADIHLSVLGLSDIAISVADTSSGNLMSLEFAYSAAKNSSGTTSDPAANADLK